MLKEEFTRTLVDGSSTEITLFSNSTTGIWIVEATNAMGTSSFVTEDRDEALECFGHPFSRETWLDYPGVNTEAGGTLRELTPEEYALAEALVAA